MTKRLLAAGLAALFIFPTASVADAPLPVSAPTRALPYTPPSLSDPLVSLTLGDTIYLALRNNPAIRSAYLQRILDKFDLQIAEDAFHPKLTLRSGFMRHQAMQASGHEANMEAESNLLTRYGTQLSLSWTQRLQRDSETGRMRSDGVNFAVIQPLLRGAGEEANMAPLQQAKISEQINQLMLKDSVSQTVGSIIYAYRDLLRAQESLTLAQDALARARNLLSINQALIDAGQMAAFELVQTEAEIASQELATEEAKNNLYLSKQALLRLTGIDLATNIQASESLQISRITLNAQRAIRLAEQQQPQFLATVLGGQQAALGLIQARDRQKWALSLVAGANQRRERRRNQQHNGKQWEHYSGLQLEIPFGDVSRDQEVARARVEVQRQEIDLQEARRELEQRVNEVVRDLDTRWRQYEIAQRSVTLSRRKLELERELLSIGRSSNFHVITFESNLRDAENARLDALINYLNAQTEMDLTLGTILESWNIALNDH